MPDDLPEPWLRGPLDNVHPLIAPVIHALMQVNEDLKQNTNGLTDEQVWSQPANLTPLGFHLQHITGSLDRLTTYLEGHDLRQEQFRFLHQEKDKGVTLPELLAAVECQIERTTRVLQSIDPARLQDARAVGRKRLPTTVIGLAVHLAEHTQRHNGQAITLCQLLKNSK